MTRPRPWRRLAMLEEEMRNFDPSLLDKPRLVALNKIDALAPDFPQAQVVLAYEHAGWRVFAVSAQTGVGLSPLREAIWEFFVRPEDQPDRVKVGDYGIAWSL